MFFASIGSFLRYKGNVFILYHTSFTLKIFQHWHFFNPMTLQWRLNGELMQQYGYNDGDTIEGTIVAVDDE